MRNKNREIKREYFFIMIGMIIFGIFIWSYSGCKSKRGMILEEKTLSSSSEEETIAFQEKPPRLGENKEEKNPVSKFNSDYFLKLEPKFAEGGRVNPFLPLTGGERERVVIPSAPTPTVSSSSLQIPTPLPTQLPPLPQQKEREITLPEVPEWPRESPVLAAGPPQKLENLLNLKVTGIAYTEDRKRRYAIIEEVISYKSSYRQEGTSIPRIRSYVVKKGDLITEYRLRVRDIKKNVVVLTRGNQKIELPLLYTPQPYTLPYESQIPASEARYKWKAEEGK